MRVGLAMPMVGSLPCEVVGPLLGLAAEIAREGEIVVATIQDYFPYDRAREYLIEVAEKAECNLVMLVDADTIVPARTFRLLKSAMETTGAAVVSGHYWRRGFPFNGTWATKDGYVDVRVDQGPMEIETCGLGCALVDMSIVSEIDAPRFELVYQNGRCIRWEDAVFCDKVRAAGGRIFGVPAVRCGHVHTRTIICDDNVDRLRATALSEGD